MNVFLGVDGGGTKTQFVLIDASGRILATRREGPAYYVEIGMETLRGMLSRTVRGLLSDLSLMPADLSFAMLGLPAYGENSALQPQLDHVLDDVLPSARYHCANDVVCGWAGALAGAEGIAVVAGTGSIAHGEYASRQARAGGWGELFSDEGSAYWIAREALSAFARMSDGRMPQGVLYQRLREHFDVTHDLDVCASVYGPPPLSRSEIAALSPLVTQAAHAGDAAAAQIFDAAAGELAALAHAVRDALKVPDDLLLPISYCGGLLQPQSMLLSKFDRALQATERRYDLVAPQLPPGVGAAVLAARFAGVPLCDAALRQLAQASGGRGLH